MTLRTVPTTRATRRERRGTPSDTAHRHAAFHEFGCLKIKRSIEILPAEYARRIPPETISSPEPRKKWPARTTTPSLFKQAKGPRLTRNLAQAPVSAGQSPTHPQPKGLEPGYPGNPNDRHSLRPLETYLKGGSPKITIAVA